MPVSRRTVLAALAGLAATPAWAQFNLRDAIGPQSDPWGQVDPYGERHPAKAVGERRPIAESPFTAPQPQQPIDIGAASEAEEIATGNSLYGPAMEESGGAHGSAAAQDALRRFAAPLIRAADRAHLPWAITLLANDDPNAWALGGGKLVVNSGLIAVADQPAMLASVIAHEIGHVDLAHAMHSERTAKLLAAFPNGTFSAEALKMVQGDPLKILFMGYKRENEFEADEHVFTIFDRTGYDPRRASQFFRQLIKIYPQTRAATTSLYSTHPGTLERIRRMEDIAASLPRPRTEPPSPGWSELKRLFPTPPDLRTS